MTFDGRPSSPGLRSYWRFLPIVVVLGGLALGYATGLQNYLTLGFLADSRDSLKGFVAANYLQSLCGFLFVYAIAVAFSFPAASALTIFGGFLFGWLVGGATVAVGATAGATVLFLAARTAFGDFLRNRVGGVAIRLADGFEDNAFAYLLVLRLAPIFPFFVMNIVPAFFNIRLRSYVSATFLGILPGTFAYAYLGEGIDSVLLAARDAGREASVADLVTPEISIAFATLAMVAAISAIVSKLRNARST